MAGPSIFDAFFWIEPIKGKPVSRFILFYYYIELYYNLLYLHLYILS